MQTLQSPTGEARIGVKDAVRIARQYIADVYGQLPPNLLLEEIEVTEDGRCWLVTYGFDRAEDAEPDNPFRATPTAVAARAFKLVRIDAYSGEPLAMKIRTP